MPVDNGFLLIDKPKGKTSRQVVDAAERRFPEQKLGHCGTLDPMAEGLIALAVGRARRLVELVHEHPKSYLATFQLGVTSQTDDATSELQPAGDPRAVTEHALREAIGQLTGTISQVPPAFSAVRIRGRRAYKLARAGKRVQLAPRQVTVYRFELLRYECPMVDVFVECSRGTYIRSLARDLGRLLGCGAVMTALRRTAIGPFRVEDAHTYEELLDREQPLRLEPMGRAATHLPRAELPHDLVRRLTQGQRVRATVPELSEPGRVAVYDDRDNLIAIAWYDPASTELRPRIVLQPAHGK